MVKTFRESVAELCRSALARSIWARTIWDRVAAVAQPGADTARKPETDGEAKRLPENDDLFYLALAKTGHW